MSENQLATQYGSLALGVVVPLSDDAVNDNDQTLDANVRLKMIRRDSMQSLGLAGCVIESRCGRSDRKLKSAPQFSRC